uniref:Retrotransposon gag domain-containing protein n=1 Tax=Ananas comosus var. bracteatus TaxID=296719 RepID=A0A6V7PEE9_ANACO|nr:unnamed protein product [Ananas comosus var. bracteatus]
MLWEEFKLEMFANYFPDTLKRKLKEKFRKLEQGDRSVAEYEQEFSHLIDCVPDVVKDDRDRADWFLRGLRPGIYKAVQILKLTTFAEVFDRALWAEHGDAHVREKREAWPSLRTKARNVRAAVVRGDRHIPRSPRSIRGLSKRAWTATVHHMRRRPPGIVL